MTQRRQGLDWTNAAPGLLALATALVGAGIGFWQDEQLFAPRRAAGHPVPWWPLHSLYGCLAGFVLGLLVGIAWMITASWRERRRIVRDRAG